MNITTVVSKKDLDYSKILNYLIVLYAFCIPISKAGTSAVAILMILFWIFESNFSNKLLEIKKSKILMTLLLFVIINITSIIWSSDKIFALDYVRKYWHLISIFIIYTSLQKKNINIIISAFLMGMFISEIVSYGIFFELWTKEGISPNDPSPFMDHTNYSIYLALTSFILLNRIFFTTNIKWKFFYFIYFIFVVSNLFLNGGRTGQVAFFICIFVVGFLNIKSKIKVIFSSLVLITIVFSTAYNFSPVFKDRYNQTVLDVSKMINNNDYSGSVSARIGLWIIGSESGLKTLLIGTGIGDEAINSKEMVEKYNYYHFLNKENINSIDYHNSFVQEFVKLGVFGLLIYLLIYYFLITMKFKSNYLKNLSVIFFTLFSFLGLVGNSLHIMASMVLFSLFVGIFASQERNA